MNYPVPTVFDTNVLIKVYLHFAILPEKSPFSEMYDALMDNKIVPVYSRQTMDELLQKLTQSKDITHKYQIAPEEAREFIEGVFYELGQFETITGTVGYSTDAKDHMFEETAIVGHAEVLISDDKHLHEDAVVVNLRKHGTKVIWSKQFSKTFKGISEESESA